MVYGEKPAILAVFATNCGIAAKSRTRQYVDLASGSPQMAP
jgi:hypothetical protein